MIRNHGQSGRKRYLHECMGYNYRMTNIAAAIGLAQLKKLDKLNARRVSNAKYLDGRLNAGKPYVAQNAEHVFHQYTIRVKEREKFLEHLEKNGVGYGIYYPVPLPRQPLFNSGGFFLRGRSCEQGGCFYPVYPSLSKEDVKRVAEVVNSHE